jgi:O-acetyl-ADP-ribose deacetylase (regulator of RNase III)
VIRAIAGDLASVPADAVVRPATTRLEPLTAALRRLDLAAGPQFLEQIRVRRELGVGSAVVTGGGDLAAEFVVHLVLGTAEDTVTTDAVRRAAEAAMFQCQQWQLATLACAVPAAGNLAPDAALQALLEVLRPHMRRASHPATVLIVTPTAADADALNLRLGEDKD